MPVLGHQPVLAGQLGQDERELADLGQPQGHGQGRADRVPQHRDDEQGDEGLDEQDDGQRRQHHQRLAEQERGVEEHAHGDEEEDGEGVPQRQGVGRRLVADGRLGDHHAGEERPQGHRRPEQGVRPGREATEKTITVRVNSSRERSRATWVRAQGTTREPATITTPTSAASLSRAIATAAAGPDHGPASGAGASPRPRTGIITSTTTVSTSWTSDHPTATCPAGELSTSASIRTRISTTVLATDMAIADHGPRPGVHAEPREHGHADRGRGQALAQRPRDRDGLDGDQVVQVEVEADAEHQQDHPDLGELVGQVQVALEAGRVRPDQHAGQQVADDRREAQPLGEQPQHPGGGEPGGDGRDQRELVHASPLLGKTGRAAAGGSRSRGPSVPPGHLPNRLTDPLSADYGNRYRPS